MQQSKLNEISARGETCLPGLLGFTVVDSGECFVSADMLVSKQLLAPNGYLHAASVIALADTACGYACASNLPEGAIGFTTIELKTNFLGTTRDGHITCTARAVHMGKSTQVWDTTVSHKETGKTLALFRCTQMILWPK